MVHLSAYTVIPLSSVLLPIESKPAKYIFFSTNILIKLIGHLSLILKQILHTYPERFYYFCTYC